MRRSCRNRRSTAKDGSGCLVVLGNRALGINRHLGLVVKVGDALGLGGNGLGGRIGNELGVDRHIALVSALVLGSIFAVRSGDGLARILALGLGAHAQHQVAQARDRAFHVGGRLVGM